MAKEVKEAMLWRRSNYDLTPKLPISDAALQALLKTVAEAAPSPMNVQSGCLVLLLGDRHKNCGKLFAKPCAGWSMMRRPLKRRRQR